MQINTIKLDCNIFYIGFKDLAMSFTSAPLPKMVKNVSTSNIKIQTYPSQNANDSPPQTQKIKTAAYEDDKERQPPKGNILHVSNISTKLTYEQIKKGLYNLFSVHGPIFEIIIKTKDNGQHFAFIDFPDIRDTEKAWYAARDEGKYLQNKRLLVNYCEDPKKNQARKDQKCFLCHGTGHKAIRCPVKPELIKPKERKVEAKQSDDQTCDFEVMTKNMKQIQPVPQESADQSESSSESQEESVAPKRDRDYLRFLKMKRKILKQRQKKKSKKSKKKRS